MSSLATTYAHKQLTQVNIMVMRRLRGPGGRFLTDKELAEHFPDEYPPLLADPDLLRLSLSGEFLTIRQPFPFLRLPSELRNHIYRHLLDKANRYPPVNDEEEHVRLSPYTPRAKAGLDTAILATNRQVHDEAAYIFYGCQLFHTIITGCGRRYYSNKCDEPLELLAPEYRRRIMHISIEIHATYHLNYIQDETQDGEKKTRAHTAQLCVLLAQCKLAEVRIHTRYLGMLQALQDSPERVNWVLENGWRTLEPFKALQNVGTVTLDGDVDPEYARVLKRTMEGEVTPEGQAMARRNPEARWTPILPKPEGYI